MAKPLPPLDRETAGLRQFPLLTLAGWILVGISILVGVLVLSPTGADYLGNNAKEVRDGAAVGSALLGQLTTLSWWPKLLAPLTFLGVASFMVGIALEFASIPAILERRTAVLKQAVPLMGRKQ